MISKKFLILEGLAVLAIVLTAILVEDRLMKVGLVMVISSASLLYYSKVLKQAKNNDESPTS